MIEGFWPILLSKGLPVLVESCSHQKVLSSVLKTFNYFLAVSCFVGVYRFHFQGARQQLRGTRSLLKQDQRSLSIYKAFEF